MKMPGESESVTVLSNVRTDMILANQRSPISTLFTYDTADPLAVTMRFENGIGAYTSWTVGRELLADGQFEPTTEHEAGDVYIWPQINELGKSVVCVYLSSPDGESLLESSASDVRSFVDGSERVMPIGEEADLIARALEKTLTELRSDGN